MAELMDRLFFIGFAAYPMVDCEYLCNLCTQSIDTTGVQMQHLSSLSHVDPGCDEFDTAEDSCTASLTASMSEMVQQADQLVWSKKMSRCGQDYTLYSKHLVALEDVITAGGRIVCTLCVQLLTLCPFSAHR